MRQLEHRKRTRATAIKYAHEKTIINFFLNDLSFYVLEIFASHIHETKMCGLDGRNKI